MTPQPDTAAQARELFESAGRRMRFSLLGFHVLVRTDRPEPLDWLRAFTAPFFAADRGEQGHWHVAYRCDRGAFDRLAGALARHPHREIASRLPDGTQLTHREVEVPGMRALRNDEFDAFCCAWPERQGLLLLSHRDDDHTRSYLARAVRKLITLHHERQGAPVLHASAFESDGSVTLAVAPKGAGKTTFLIRHLLDGARFVSNDRTLLHAEPGRVAAYGLPNVVTLHPGTVDLFPEIRPRLAHLPDWQEPTRGRDDGRRRITAAQLCGLTGADSAAGAPVRRIVFPSPDIDGARPAPPDEAGALLRQAVFDYGDRRRVFFSSLYPVDLDRFRQAVDSLCEVLLATCACSYQGWAAKDDTSPERAARAAAPGGQPTARGKE